MLDSTPKSHAALMDQTYRRQRLIYDLTRKYYLFGRDRLIADLNPKAGAHILEVACGTGRNLQVAARTYPHCAFYGLDISSEMLTSARAKLGTRVQLAQADACDFDAGQLFRRAEFDRIFISYGVSMIPDWQAALRMAYRHLTPGGSLHVVDFSDQSGWPRWFEAALNRWLQKFHVAPRRDLDRVLTRIAAPHGAKVTHRQLYRGYAQYGVIQKPRSERRPDAI
ncbi:class I SAM-dependent methyltransferase [Tritonibacter horizontis]|uniref:Demethylmenaquinone methyltransferase n=1 Tax=Tritonibacter horizontis TaxID=1768241 RepID=A0A132BZW1_9RHOB|nr:class I SAM-dependent methyltransferase [Tritonibacter horizontis]KUP93300.1 demethylmenaquinone methyltransferase [Tritonibacter horizontis]